MPWTPGKAQVVVVADEGIVQGIFVADPQNTELLIIDRDTNFAERVKPMWGFVAALDDLSDEEFAELAATGPSQVEYDGVVYELTAAGGAAAEGV